MKKIFMLLILLLSACTVTTNPKESATPASTACAVGSEKECEEVENKQYEELIATDTFVEMTFSELVKAIENKETFVAYIGFKTCPWCQDAIPFLKEEADLAGLKINYINARPDGDTKEFDIRLDTNPDYVKLQEIFKDIMLDDTNKIYVPIVVTIKDGNILDYHYATVENHNASEREMTEDEIKQLQTTYKTMFKNFK